MYESVKYIQQENFWIGPGSVRGMSGFVLFFSLLSSCAHQEAARNLHFSAEGRKSKVLAAAVHTSLAHSFIQHIGPGLLQPRLLRLWVLSQLPSVLLVAFCDVARLTERYRPGWFLGYPGLRAPLLSPALVRASLVCGALVLAPNSTRLSASQVLSLGRRQPQVNTCTPVPKFFGSSAL